MKGRKLIIIGAPRSGTNKLRDVLTSLDGIVTWPCDEINYIWRYKNKTFPSDQITVDKVTPEIKKYINKCFDKIAIKYGGSIVVEKTCANSLRVPFVDEILPDAKYIFIIRDGMDAAGSAKHRWTAKLDISYLISKLKFVPLADLPYYSVRYLWARVYSKFSREKRLAFWGPYLENMEDILQKHPLNEVCALQWQKCVELADLSFSSMPADKFLRLSYESFVTQPAIELTKILNFIDVEVDAVDIKSAIQNVSSRSLGKGRNCLEKDEARRLEHILGNTLKRHGYL